MYMVDLLKSATVVSSFYIVLVVLSSSHSISSVVEKPFEGTSINTSM